MLFSKLFTATAVASMASNVQASLLDFQFDEHFDFTLNLPNLAATECEVSEVQVFGLQQDLDVSLSLLKRDVEQQEQVKSIAKRADTPPKADLSVSAIERLADDLFKVTINFETVISADLLSLFGSNAGTAVISGLGVGADDVQLIAGVGSEGNIGNLFQWSAAVLVNASIHGDLFCLPDGLNIAINIDADAGVDVPLLDDLKSVLPSNFVYTLEQDLQNAASAILKRDLINLDLNAGVNVSLLNLVNLDVNADLNLDVLLGSSVLPNFCWSECAITSSSEVSSASSEVSSASSEVSSVSSEVSSASSEVSSASSEVSSASSEVSSASSEVSSASSEVSSASPSGEVSTTEVLSTSSTTEYSCSSSTEVSSATDVVPSASDNGCPECTIYTTTFTTTDSTGGAETETGIVHITTTEGELTTWTDIIGCPECTEYSTTLAATGTDGNPTSESAIVIVSTDSAGDLYSLTEVFEGPSTTVVTITSCSEDKCSEAAVTTGVTTVSDETTVYTTYCPLSEEPETVTDISTTVVTVTSCEDDKCTEKAVTTGVTTVSDETTVYTTYCPLSEEETTTLTQLSTTVVTVTSCQNGECNEKAVTTGVTTYSDDTTTVTTYCPLTEEGTTLITTPYANTSVPTTVAPVVTSSGLLNSTAEISTYEALGNVFSVSLGAIFAGVFIVFNI